jgi:hypothetical protein
VQRASSHIFFFWAELIASRASAWTHIASRKHVIRRVYTASVEEVGEHVVMLGDLNLVLKNGTELEMGFATRMMVDNAESAEPRIELCQVWAVGICFILIFVGLRNYTDEMQDSAPLMKALSESKAGPEDGDHEQAVSHSS